MMTKHKVGVTETKIKLFCMDAEQRSLRTEDTCSFGGALS